MFHLQLCPASNGICRTKFLFDESSICSYFALQMFFPMGKISVMIYGGLASIVFCGYIVYDTDNLIKRYSYDEYIWAAVALYLDVINLFLSLLSIFRAADSWTVEECAVTAFFLLSPNLHGLFWMMLVAPLLNCIFVCIIDAMISLFCTLLTLSFGSNALIYV